MVGVFIVKYSFNINSQNTKYSVNISNNDFLSILKNYDLIICDDYFKSKVKSVKVPKIFVNATEENKTIDYSISLIENMIKNKLNKDSKVILIGGGIVQDLGTFIASIYMRGIYWDYVPTTLTAILDSCIGGKSSINVSGYKNIVGNFYPPKNIFIHTQFIKSLNQIQVISGLSEAMKICYAKDKKSFLKFLNLVNNYDKSNLIQNQNLILHILKTKKFFIEKDEFDTGIRKKLNFGHTYGHAIEQATDFKIQHGVAVLIGMISACLHPDSKFQKNDPNILTESLKLSNSIKNYILENTFNLNYSRFVAGINIDKKNSLNSFRLILPSIESVALKTYKKSNNNYKIAYLALKKGLDLINES